MFPKPPKLSNRDGDPIEFSTSYFKLSTSVEKAFKALLPLSGSEDEKDFLNSASYDQKGELESVEFPWLEASPEEAKGDLKGRTVLGEFHLTGKQLVLKTNSEKRMQSGIKLLEAHLNKVIEFERFETESFETAASRLSIEPGKANAAGISPSSSPALEAELASLAKAHWENWFTESIPALGDLTPREAAKTEKGRERLEALFLIYEFDAPGEDETNEIFKPDLAYLRAELELD